ncbi:MAG: ribonuclease J [Actinomycetota bacterium]
MSSPLRIIFLGGLGEVGRNMIALEEDDSMIVIDSGLSFPNDEMLGVDLVLPDFTYISERAQKVKGIVLTHGHEDHVGALSWLLRDVDAPVYGTPLTLGIARRRLDEFGVKADMHTITAPGSLELGPFQLGFLANAHSIPDTVSVSVRTRNGHLIYTSDYKFDETPIDGRHTDIAGLRHLGDEGIDLLLSDSTNAERPGRTPSERVVGDTLRQIFLAADKRIIAACFASNMHRVQQILEIAQEMERRVAFVGRSMVNNLEVGRELGYLTVSDETILPIDDLQKLAPEDTVIVCTGSQGEPLAALSLIAAGNHKLISIEPGDTVILSASPIPGNESAVHRVLNGLYKAGADVYHSGTSAVHVSGHGAADELGQMIDLIRPKHFVPVHGEYRQLATHAKIAAGRGIHQNSITIVEDGDVLEMTDGKVKRGDKVSAGMILVDGLGVGDVGPVVLRDRRHLAQDGVIICVLTIEAHTGEIMAGPDLITRGFVFEEESRDLLDEAADLVLDALDHMEEDHVTDWGAIKKTCRRALGKFVWERTRRRPMILPIIMEV